ncbi:MAG: RES family NAD+ phosphorylase [Verrucomicrobiota bacterium]
MEPSDDELRKHFNLDENIPVLRKLPSKEALQGEMTFLEKLGDCFGLKGWMWKDWKGVILGIIVVPSAAAGLFDFWQPKLEVGYEHAKPYVQAAGQLGSKLSDDFVTFLNSPLETPRDPSNIEENMNAVLAPRIQSQSFAADQRVLDNVSFKIYRFISQEDAHQVFLPFPYPVSSRWNREGALIKYATMDPLQAIAELRDGIGAKSYKPEDRYVIFEADIEGTARILQSDELPKSWNNHTSVEQCRAISAEWLARAEAGILLVPSHLDPSRPNVLLSTEHPDYRSLKVVKQHAINI